jgi:hypothetical protein
MMEFLTWGEIKAEVQKDHGIEGDPDYDEQELINLCNRAINRVESRVLQLQQDYFLVKADPLAVTAGQVEYDLPSDIYANKIRRIFWDEPNYNRRRLWRATNIDDMEETNKYGNTYDYDKKLRYMIFNSSSGGRKITLSYSAVDANLIIYYTRNANRFNAVDGDAQVCDIPEFVDAVIAHMKYSIEKKDKSPTTAVSKQDYIEIMTELTSSLGVAVNDEDQTIEPDAQIWEDHT